MNLRCDSYNLQLIKRMFHMCRIKSYICCSYIHSNDIMKSHMARVRVKFLIRMDIWMSLSKYLKDSLFSSNYFMLRNIFTTQ